MKQEKSANSKFCELELKYKPHPRYKSVTDLPKITKSYEAVNLIIEEIPEIIGSAQEMFIVVLLNRSNRVLVVQKLFVGGISATIVDLKLILKIALSFGASGIMLCHNHPSGELKPSQHDIK
ncbi:MAG: DNA repair protein [Bacteroidetes bacterium]|nr:DNA repair protein [Bacteroidota bacterium]